ncbi:MFS transporter [Ornithinimicrobium sp. F0845]|uniref:MFS transporter n=1 Tax=Ornithinimicrobium sp. F0845 TaxID=2926412 RepID=UPI001FF4512E|nr:MFS transporter [Ornithinimicrobium sp. F0845]
MLILGYGVLGGFGLGLAYMVPIAMLQKWYPDKRGLITGIAVGGFGFGAVITSPLAQQMIAGSADYQQYPTKVFLWLGIAYLVAGVLGASVFRNPPEGYTVPGAAAPAALATTCPRPQPRGKTCRRLRPRRPPRRTPTVSRRPHPWRARTPLVTTSHRRRPSARPSGICSP